MMMLSHCQFQLRLILIIEEQSVHRSTDDFYFVGNFNSSFNSRLSHPFRSSFFFFPETLDMTGIQYTQVTFGRDCLTESLNKPFYPWTLSECRKTIE